MRRPAIQYSAAELRFIESNCAMNRRALCTAFVERFGRIDVGAEDIKNLCSREGWVTRTRWSAEEEALLRELYPDTPTKHLAKRLGRSLSTTFQHARRLGLEKSEAYLASPAACRLRREDGVGVASRFLPGHVPANKGLRRPGWAPGRMKATQFNKGARSGKAAQHWMPIGSTRVSGGYEYTKISDVPNVPYTRNWKPTHVLRWEEQNGKLPTGHCLKALDSNRLNTSPANWVAIPRAMLPLLNGICGRDFDNAPPELRASILAIAKLQHAANAADGLTAAQRMIKKRKQRQQAEQRSAGRGAHTGDRVA